MNNKPGTQGFVWLVQGAVVLALLLAVVWYFRTHQAQLLAAQASRAGRVELVGQMQLALASASEAEKSAVLATTDDESAKFAAQARAASAQVERKRQELGRQVAGTQREVELLSQFSTAFADLQHVDQEVLRLAVQNTNLKAYALLFGPAAETLAQLDAALARVVERRADALDASQATLLADGARLGVLRIQAALAPHIAEASDVKMDQLEAAMAQEEGQVRKDLAGLGALPTLGGDADLATAAASFARYAELKTRILALSRENTNVHSLAMSLGQKRKALVLCLDALDALKRAIFDEPVGQPTSPR